MRYKCAASIDGECRNVLGFGAKCNGYSDKCRLRNLYCKFDAVLNSAEERTRKAYGIIPDNDEVE